MGRLRQFRRGAHRPGHRPRAVQHGAAADHRHGGSASGARPRAGAAAQRQRVPPLEARLAGALAGPHSVGDAAGGGGGGLEMAARCALRRRQPTPCGAGHHPAGHPLPRQDQHGLGRSRDHADLARAALRRHHFSRRAAIDPQRSARGGAHGRRQRIADPDQGGAAAAQAGHGGNRHADHDLDLQQFRLCVAGDAWRSRRLHAGAGDADVYRLLRRLPHGLGGGHRRGDECHHVRLCADLLPRGVR